MKKALKITGIALASLIALILIVGAIVVWLVLTPERLTPIVRNQAGRFITCATHLDKVELTLFKTFPQIGLQINNLVLINPVEGTPSDTLASIDKCIAALNIRELINNNSIVVNEFYLVNGTANLFIDSLGKSNFDILNLESNDDDTSSFKLGEIDLDKVSLENINASYTDLSSEIQAKVNQLNLTVKGNMKDDNISANLKLQTSDAAFSLLDSVPIFVTANALNTKFKGNMTNLDMIKGDLELALKDVSFDMGNENYAKSVQLAITTPVDLSIEKQDIVLSKTEILLNQFQIYLNGTASRNAIDGDIAVDVGFSTNHWDIEEVIELIPQSFASVLDSMSIAGDIFLSGKAMGIYNDSLIPLISADVLLKEGSFAMQDIPFPFNDINADIHAGLDLQSISNVQIRNFQAKTGNSSVSCSGTVRDVLNKMFCDLKLNAKLVLPEFQSVIPKEIQAKGLANTSLQTSFSLEQIQKLALEKIKVNGWIDFTDLDILYNDSIAVKSPATHIDIQLPSASGNTTFKELLSARIETKQLDANMVGLLSGGLRDVKLGVGVSDFMDTTSMLSVACDFDFSKLSLLMDTLKVDIDNPSGKFSMYPSTSSKTVPAFDITYESDHLSAEMGKNLSLVSKDIRLKGTAQYDKKQEDIILQLDPRFRIDFQQGILHIGSFPIPIEIPSIKSNFTPERFTIRESQIILGHSDFKLSGIVTNLDKYLDNTGLLTGNLKFVSDHTDVTELMDLVNGLGVDSTIVNDTTGLESQEDNPFMVPMGIDVTLHTLIKKATVGKTHIEDIEGQLTIEDGILVLEEMGFTSEAARMQLTAMYRSPRKNHLYAGVDFHLLDIDIAKLIEMIPDIDTIVPMLKSFAGKAEFHFAIETYLKSNYDLKYSTLRGAAAISGQDLVLLDSKTFSKMSKLLQFKKKTENKVDSISVEMTIFRNEVDLYPFLVVMDKYRAIVQGRYNINAAGEYDISITQTPFPIRLGLNIKGPVEVKKRGVLTEKYKFKLNLFPRIKPSYRVTKKGVVDSKVMELKQIISQSLKRGVKEQEQRHEKDSN
jgi:hypothetical protein